MKVIQKFENKYVYDTYVDESFKITHRKISVLREVMHDGASISTYIIKYPKDSRLACVSKDMYHDTPEQADAEAMDSLVEGIDYAKDQITMHEEFIKGAIKTLYQLQNIPS